jgi:hypothetical protein
MALSRFNRALDAATASEDMSTGEGLTSLALLSVEEPLREDCRDDSLDKRPALAAITANSALTDTFVSMGISNVSR